MADIGPLINFLTKGVRAALPTLTALAATNLSPTQILSRARAMGFAFETQQAFDVIAALRQTQSAAQYIRSQLSSTPLNPDFFGKNLYSMLRNYRYTVNVRGVNPDTGETINQPIVISTNQILSKDQILAIATEKVTDPNKKYYVDIESLTVVDAQKKAGL